MDCPRCKQVSPDCDACPRCGWPEEQFAADPADARLQDDAIDVAPAAEAAATEAVAVEGRLTSNAPEPAVDADPSTGVAPGAAAPGGAAPGALVASAPADVTGDPRAQDDGSPAGDTQNEYNLQGKLRTLNVVNGNRALITESLNVYYQEERTSEPAKNQSLLEITLEFKPDPRQAESFDPVEVAVHTRLLKEDRLLLVSCPLLAHARAAVQAMVRTMELQPERVRLLNFDRLGSDNPPLTVYELLKGRSEPEAETVVVADAVSPVAQPFLDSLLGARGLWSGSDVVQSLAERGIRLICVVEPQRYAEFVRVEEEVRFPHWAVPFLEPFLRRKFPADHDELRSTIVQQRAEGRWSPDDAGFWDELRTLAAQGRLREAVASGGVPPEQPVELEDGRPVHQSVRFTGAFFTALSPTDFDQVVVTLLGDASLPVPLAAGTDGATAEFRDKPLTQIWRESPDRIMRECGLVVLPDAEAGRAVEFREPGTRETLRERLESDYPFQLHATFRALHESGLLFTASDAVARNVVLATAHMAESYPETYGREWVAGILILARVRTSDLMPAGRIVRRFGELLRETSTRPGIRSLVGEVLDWLLGRGEFDIVFALVKQLRFAPEFDAFRWLRQLINQGNAAARTAAERFLHRELASVGEQVYPTLHVLAEWLPDQERKKPDSPSNRVALRLLVEYAAGITARFDPEQYGEWPTRFPLLAVGGDTVGRDLGLLVRWLLHPGVVETVRDGDMRPAMPRLLAALVAEWTFILFGPTGTPAPPFREPAAEPEDEEDSRERIFTALLAEIAAATGTPQGRAVRREMTAYWEEMKQSLVPAPGMTRAERQELAWKRGLFRDLLLRFRALQAPPAAASGSPPAPVSKRG